MVRQELEDYGGGLTDKVEIIGLNKTDALLDDEIEEKRAALAEVSGQDPDDIQLLSGVTGRGVLDLCRRLYGVIDGAKEEEKAAAEPLPYQP